MKRGLMSLEQQTFKDFEAIFVDDCSTDGTYLQLLDYQQKSNLNIIVLRNVQNVGPGQSRNYAISQAQGKYLAFMDSDDWYETNLLEEVHNKIVEESADMVFFDFYRAYNENKKKHIQATRQLKDAHAKADFVALCFDSLCSMCVIREAFQNLEIPNIYNAEDAVTIPLLVNKVSRIAILDKPLYNYFYRINSLSSSKNIAISDSFLRAFSFLTEHLPNDSEKEALEYRGILMVLYAYVYKALQGDLAVDKILPVVNRFVSKYPDYHANKYKKFIPIRKRLFIQCVKFHHWPLLRIYIKMQDWLISLPVRINHAIDHA